MSDNELIISLREKVDELDAEIADLVCSRVELAVKIAEIKQAQNVRVYDATREQEIEARYRERLLPIARAQDITDFVRSLIALNRHYKK